MQKVVISFKDISGKVALNENEMENGLDCCEVIKTPEAGMTFDSVDSLYEYYRQYGRQEGFGVKKKTSRPSPCGKLKFMSLSCTRAGKSMSQKQNYLTPNPLTRIECKARVNATMFEDGRCKINSVALNHNHELSPSKSQFYSCNREKVIGVRRKFSLDDQKVIGVKNNHQSLEIGGCDDVRLPKNECLSSSEKGNRLQFRPGDAKAMQDFFVRMQTKNSNFFYMVDMEDGARINNVFWADARSRAMYEEFGDVVSFDTTYLSGKYELPLTSFIGINHHGQAILLGCALLSNDDPATFTWLFKTWLACMSGRAPNSIITDEHKSIAKAIDAVFPNSRHRWCLSQVMKKLLHSIKGYKTYDHIKVAMQDAIYDSLTKKEFEERWERVVKDFNLHDNSWLSSLFDERNRWVPAFLKDAFWAGMSTTQWDESLNPFFSGRVSLKTTFKHFIEEYDKALRNKVEKEQLADFQCFSTWIPCVTLFEVEKQFQAAYTNTKFKEFQKELTGKLYCEVSSADEKNGIFDVSEALFVGEKRKQIRFTVHFNAESHEVKCTCGLFEFKGILCKHSISVLMKMEIIDVPEKYILPRWRKDIKRCHTRVKVGYYDDWTSNLETQRYEKLLKKFNEAADWAVSSEEKMMMLWNSLDEFQSRKTKPLEG